MAQVIDYDYIQEVSTLDALHNMTSDVTTGYDTEIPGVNTFKINAQVSTYNFPEGGGGGEGIAGWSTNITWYSSSYNRVGWNSGYIYLPDGTRLSVSAGTAPLTAVTYIYYDQENSGVYYTTTAADSVGENKILLCVAGPTSSGKSCSYQAFGTNAQSTLITASNIASNTITANEINANTISSNDLIGNTITGRTIRTSSSGERFVMSSSEVAQYNSSGVKRVQYMGNGIQFYDSSGIATASIRGQNGAIYIDGDLDVSYIDAYSITSTNGNFDSIWVDDYLQNSGDTYLTGTLKIPVGTDLYN